MTKIEEMLLEFDIPKVAKVQQKFDRTQVVNLEEYLSKLLRSKNLPVNPGDRIAITGSSRGIADYPRIMRTAVHYIKEKGGIPFIVPAMGSHGGGVAEKQTELLAELGITAETVGAPIISSMEVVEIAKTALGLPVYIDRNAAKADGILLLNRVKTHTSIREQYQSGLIKMLAIGLAKHKGCAMTHSLGTLHLGENMVRVGLTALKNLKVIGGIAAIENGYDELADLYVLQKEEIPEQEPIILERAKNMIPHIYLDQIDVLIIYEQGKEIAGTGMDPAVVGRSINRMPNIGPNVESIGVLRLTAYSDGNASGCGIADFISRKLRDEINEEYTIINSITGMKPTLAKIPPTLENDELVIKACIKNAGKIPTDQLKMVIIRNSGNLDEVWMSEAAYDIAKETGCVEKLGKYEPIKFDAEKNILLQNM